MRFCTLGCPGRGLCASLYQWLGKHTPLAGSLAFFEREVSCAVCGKQRGPAMSTLDQIQPYTPLIVMALNGLIAGWIVGEIIGGGGVLRNLVVGIVGAFVGGALVRYGLLTLPSGLTNVTNSLPYGTQIVMSTIGAAIVVLIARFLVGRAA